MHARQFIDEIDMKINNIKNFSLCLTLLIVFSCSFDGPKKYVIDYKDTSFHRLDRMPDISILNTAILIFTTNSEDQYIFSGKPSSQWSPGSGTILVVPLGLIAKKAIEYAVEDNLGLQAEFTNSLETATRYSIIIHPTVENFSYNYVSLLGGGIEPTVSVSASIGVTCFGSSNVWKGSYDSGPVDGEIYYGWPLTRTPFIDLVGDTVYKAVLQVMYQATADIKSQVQLCPAGK
jgi:hypothetical protein